MANQILGTAALLCVGLCFFFAFRFYTRQEYNKALYLIILSGIILRLFAASDLFLHPWDERYHALVAKNIMKHPFVPTLYDTPFLDYDYKSWVSNHIWLHKPPMTLWILALSLRTFGTNEIALRLPSIVLSSLLIFFIYFIGKVAFNEKVGIIACFFASINGFLIELAGGKRPTDHVDTVFIFFVTLGIFLSFYILNKRTGIMLLLIGVTTGLAVLTKWLTGLLVIPVLFILLLNKYNFKNAVLKSLIVFFISLIIFLPWQIYIHQAFPKEAGWEQHFNVRHIFEPLEGHSGSIFFYIFNLPRIFGELIYIPIIFFFYQLKNRRSDYKMIAISFWLILPYLFFSFVASKMPAYVMISSPAIFLILAYFCWYLIDNMYLFKHKKLIVILLILLILLPIRYSLERAKPFKNYDKNPDWVKNLRALNNLIEDRNSVLFNVKLPIEAMFYTRFTAYSFIPTLEQIRQLHERSYKIVLLDGDRNLPDYIRGDKRIIIIK